MIQSHYMTDLMDGDFSHSFAEFRFIGSTGIESESGDYADSSAEFA